MKQCRSGGIVEAGTFRVRSNAAVPNAKHEVVVGPDGTWYCDVGLGDAELQSGLNVLGAALGLAPSQLRRD